MPASTELADRRILVTGASGFIGRRLCRRLAGLGGDVHGTSRRVAPVDLPITWHRLELGLSEDVDRLISELRPEVVLHLASAVTGARGVELVRPTFTANLASTVYLMTAATRAGGCHRFVLAGSLEEPDEDQPLAAPASPYAAAKSAAAAYGRLFHAHYGLPVVHARLFMVYGPEQQDLKKLIPYLILARLTGREARLSSGTRPIDWVFVDDVVEGLVRCATHDAAVGRRVDLGSGELVTLRSAVEELYRQLGDPGDPPFGTLPDRPLEQVRRADADATETVLGWRPATPLADGLAATVAWYRDEVAAGRLEAGG